MVGVSLLFSLLTMRAPGAGAATDVAVGFGGNEPTAGAVNPLNPQNVVVARCQLGISNDFGRTFPITVNVGVPAAFAASFGQGCDDVVTFDSQGRLFWTYLLRVDQDGNPATGNGGREDLTVVVQQVNPTTGALIGNAVDITPGPASNSDDKPWIAADATPGSPFRDNIYIVWSRLTSGSQVMFSRSTNGGTTWSAPTQISAGGEGFVWPSHVAVAPNGDVYASYHTDTCGSTTADMAILRDSSGGANLQNAVAVQKTTFQSAVTCNVQTGSGVVPNTDFWMQGALAPYVIPDPVRANTIYVIANDDPNNNFGNGDDGDVILAKSTDNGNTWGISTISHAPAGTLQVFPIGAIDQLGRLVVAWYDTRAGRTNAGGNLLLDVFATTSNDGGATFSNDFQVNDTAFDPDLGAPCRFGCGGPGDPGPATRRIGEYNGLAAADGIAYLAWTGNTGSGQQTLFDVFSIQGTVPDRFEPNDAAQPGVITELGAHDGYDEANLTIHSPTDEDFYRIQALRTGSLSVRMSSNAGLSDLDVQVRDSNGNVVGTSSSGIDTAAIETVTWPAVAGQNYTVRVYAEPGAPAAPTQVPPMNVYALTGVNRAASAPLGLALDVGADTGTSTTDNVTRTSRPPLAIRVDLSPLAGLTFSAGSNPTTDNPGYKVAVNIDGALAGYATSAGNGLFTFTPPNPLSDGLHLVTAAVVVVDPRLPTPHAVGSGPESSTLALVVDTTAPSAPSAPDLAAASDTGGVSDDNITTVQSPTFTGTAVPNSPIHLYADGVVVGDGQSDGNGNWQVKTNALGDGVYQITAKQEDVAGNLSAASPALKVTIANQGLTLPGLTATAPAGQVTVDLAAGTVAGYGGVPGVTGLVGIVGIPTVNLAVNNQKVSVLGTAGDDNLTYTPLTASAGSLTRAGVTQTLNLTNVSIASDGLKVDTLAGADVVTTVGTTGADTINATVLPTAITRITGLLPISTVTSNLERLAISSGEGADTITVVTSDQVNALVLADGGNPATNTPNGDVLQILDGSGKGQLGNGPGGAVAGSGSFIMNYPRTTLKQTRIDYAGIEKILKR